MEDEFVGEEAASHARPTSGYAVILSNHVQAGQIHGTNRRGP
jgi:hypothetical protein